MKSPQTYPVHCVSFFSKTITLKTSKQTKKPLSVSYLTTFCFTSHRGVSFLSCLLITHSFFLSLPFYSSFSFSLPSLLYVLLCSLHPPSRPQFSLGPFPTAPTHPFPRTLCSGLLLPSCGRNQNCSRTWAVELLGRRLSVRKRS